MQPGIYPDWPRTLYDSIEAVNQSSLRHYRKTPAHWLAWKRSPRVATDSMRLGNLIEDAVQNPALFASRYVVMPDLTIGCKTKSGKISDSPKSTEDYKERVAQFGRENAGKEFIEQAELDTCKAVCESISGQETASELLGCEGQNQVAIVWNDPETGLLCKALIDRRILGGRTILDLKTTQDAHWFPKHCHDYGYHVQAAFYLWGLSVLGETADEFLHVVCETSDPFGVKVMRMGDTSIDQGYREFRKYLDLHAECVRNNRWPNYPSGIEDFELPRYAFTKDGIEA